MKNMLRIKNKKMADLAKPFSDETAGPKGVVNVDINIRNLKVFLFVTFVISPYEIENAI